MKPITTKQLYRVLWRWHFYAGIFTLPFIVVLSISGALYLFKPQIDAFHDVPYRNLSINGNLTTPEQQLVAALAAVPNATFSAYELPRETTDATNIILIQANKKIRVYIHPQTLSMLAIEAEEKRFLHIVHDLHGELLLGKFGSVLVELAASWTIVLVLTGIYLWWPRNTQGLAGILYPRLKVKGGLCWRDWHSVTGIWVSFFVLCLLLSGLPWAFVWGSALKEIREFTDTPAQQQDWVIAARKNITNNNTDEHAEHFSQHRQENIANTGEQRQKVSLNSIVNQAKQLHFTHPVLVMPPSQKSPDWAVKSNAQNRPLRADAYFDVQSGEIKHQQSFSQRHFIDRAIGFGIAMHEGQLFGWFNQLLGLLTTMSLVLMSASGFIMWRKRKVDGVLGAPPAMPNANIGLGFMSIIFMTAILLPALGASLMFIALLECLILVRLPLLKKWLGLV